MKTYHRPTNQPDRLKPLPSEEYVVKTMPPVLGTFDMTAIFLMAIFWITNTTVAATAGPAALTYLLLNGLTFFIPCAVVTTQLGVMFTHEGSIYNWTHKALGPYWSFFIGFCFWFPSVLAIVSGADAFVAYLQGLNSNWLTEPWQQGLVIIFLIAFTGFLSMQRFRMVQNMVNAVIGFIFLAVFLIVLSAIVWFAKGNASATDFSHLKDWIPNSGNFSLFGLITFVYIGTNIPLNMGGEIAGAGNGRAKHRVVTRHIFWGTLIVLIGYLLTIFSLLLVRGPAVLNAPILSFEWVTMVSVALGKFAGGIIVICIMSFFIMASVVYNVALARLLLVGSIDQRLPRQFALLNKHRSPANAIVFQTTTTIIFTVIAFIIVPFVIRLGNPIDLTTEVFNVSLASLTLVWTFATIFFFIDLLRIYFHDRQAFHQQRIFPMPVLWASAIIGPIACAVTIADTLLNSWIPQIGNDKWWYIVGGVTIAFILFASIGSMLASSQAAWEDMNQLNQ